MRSMSQSNFKQKEISQILLNQSILTIRRGFSKVWFLCTPLTPRDFIPPKSLGLLGLKKALLKTLVKFPESIYDEVFGAAVLSSESLQTGSFLMQEGALYRKNKLYFHHWRSSFSEKFSKKGFYRRGFFKTLCYMIHVNLCLTLLQFFLKNNRLNNQR